jgi:hypothetical protein
MSEENKSGGCHSCKNHNRIGLIRTARYWFRLLSNEERMQILLDYCKYCGMLLSKNEQCVCQNDK